MSTTEQDKSHMMQDQMSINCPNLLGWKVTVFLTLSSEAHKLRLKCQEEGTLSPC